MQFAPQPLQGPNRPGRPVLPDLGIIHHAMGYFGKGQTRHRQPIISRGARQSAMWRHPRREATQFIQRQCPQCILRQLQMTNMNRIKGTAENTVEFQGVCAGGAPSVSGRISE